MASAVSQVESVCQQCGGSGWRPEPVEGKPTPRVIPCECRESTQLQRRLLRAGIPKRFADRSLDNFQTNFAGDINDSLSLALSAAKRFVREYPMLNRAGLLLHGPCGVGKSHLAVAIVRELTQRGIAAQYCNTKDLLQSLRYSFNPVAQTSEAELLANIIECEVLVLDDLGAERLTDWVQETMYHVINSRYQTDRTTLITTNLEYGAPNPTEEEHSNSRLTGDQARRVMRKETLGDRVGQRIWSRLTEMCRPLAMHGEDQREKLRKR